MKSRSSNNPLEFIAAVSHIAKMAKKSQKMPEEAKKKWRADMYTHRWKYFLTLPLFLALCVFFLWIGIHEKERFNIINWYIFMGFASLLLLIGLFTWLNYLWLIIKGKSN